MSFFHPDSFENRFFWLSRHHGTAFLSLRLLRRPGSVHLLSFPGLRLRNSLFSFFSRWRFFLRFIICPGLLRIILNRLLRFRRIFLILRFLSVFRLNLQGIIRFALHARLSNGLIGVCHHLIRFDEKCSASEQQGQGDPSFARFVQFETFFYIH